MCAFHAFRCSRADAAAAAPAREPLPPAPCPAHTPTRPRAVLSTPCRCEAPEPLCSRQGLGAARVLAGAGLPPAAYIAVRCPTGSRNPERVAHIYWYHRSTAVPPQTRARRARPCGPFGSATGGRRGDGKGCAGRWPPRSQRPFPGRPRPTSPSRQPARPKPRCRPPAPPTLVGAAAVPPASSFVCAAVATATRASLGDGPRDQSRSRNCGQRHARMRRWRLLRSIRAPL